MARGGRRTIGILLASLVASGVAGQEDASTPSSELGFERIVLSEDVPIGYGVAIADVDGDADLDALLVDRHRLRWFENPSWAEHEISGRLTQRDHVCLAARDLDGDGRCEVAVGGEWNPGDTENSGAVFWLPRSEEGFGPAFRLPHEPTTHRMRWRRRADGRHALVVVPLHGRGSVRGEGPGVKVLESLPPGDDPAAWIAEWSHTLLCDRLHFMHNLDVVQFDEDPAEELLFAAKEGLFLFDEGAAELRPLVDASQHPEFPGASEVRLGKLRGGARFLVAVQPFHGNRVVAYRETEGAWEAAVLDDSLNQAHALACADFLGDGSTQVVVGWRNPDAEGQVGVRLYVLDQTGALERRLEVDRGGMACEDLRVADFDGDGKPDILAAGRATANLVLYRSR